MLSYKNAGVVLPRTSIEQSKVGQEIKLNEAQPGDLIFFKFKKSKSSNPVNHVGIVSRIDRGGTLYFYHASTSLGVTESSLAETYYKEVFVKLMRVY
jgi:cell wall-associated NlpC family hydrolase